MSPSSAAPDVEAVAAEPFVSYSINFEDVVLRRLFRGRRTGFFVDVGAQHPIISNDFFGLYTLGWSGINIEPNPSYVALLQEHRPRDLNLQLALSDVADQPLVFFEVEGSGLSTCDETQAAACVAQGYVVKRHDVRSSTLEVVLNSTLVPHIDVLKVDVEGLEENVLLGNDWARFRPSVIMVEVTYPETSLRRPTGIRNSLEGLGYRHIYFDNLNDFFADADFEVPADAILPPNVFDHFVQHDFVALQEENASIKVNFQVAETYAHTLEVERAALGKEREALQGEVTSLQDAFEGERIILQRHSTALNEALGNAHATAATTRRLAVAAILGRSNEVRALLTGGPAPGPEQERGRAMPEQGRELVTVAGEGVINVQRSAESTALMPADIRMEMLAAQLQASNEQNSHHLDDLSDLRHENRRLLAALRQAQGENMSLQRALGPSYATRDELLQLRESLISLQSQVGQHHQATCDESLQLREGLGSLQSQVGQHHQAMSADFEARVQAALDERVRHMVAEAGQRERAEPPFHSELASARMLEAVLTSTSWRLTKPLRTFRNLFGPPQK